MSRNELDASEATGLNQARAISPLLHLKIVGIMSHYPEKDSDNVRVSLARFNQQSKQVLAVTGRARMFYCKYFYQVDSA